MTDRGVSETIGFIVIFAVIISSIGLVYANGLTGLEHIRNFERTNNAQHAFEVLTDNIEDIVTRGAPSRATEIKVTGANLRVAKPITFTINVEDTEFSQSYDARPIVYDAETDEQIIFSQGAIIRKPDGDTGLVTQESLLVLNENITVIPVIQTRLDGVSSISGRDTVLVRATHSKTMIVYANISATNTVWMNITSSRAGAWNNYLEDNPNVECVAVVDETAACRVTTDQVYVSVVLIDINLE